MGEYVLLPSIPGHGTRIKAAGLAVAAALVLGGCGTNAGETAAAADPASARVQAVVVRVIDGDTFKATVGGEEKTIRLLNVDTPETKDPNAPVECLGPEATKALEQLLPAGSTVGLELDVEPLDKYGRTLAGVFDSSDMLVNAELARLGLGVPVIFEPNKKFYPPVADAFEEARSNRAGLNSTSITCLPAQQIEQAAKVVDTAAAVPLTGTAADLDRSHDGLVTALATIAALKVAANARTNIHWGAYTTDQVGAMVKRLDSASAAGNARQAAIAAKKKDLADAAAAETARQAAAASAEAAAAAEAERIRNLPPAPAPYVPPAYVPPAPAPYVAPPAPAANPYPGYNGPRCYAPGGKTWTPCSKK